MPRSRTSSVAGLAPLRELPRMDREEGRAAVVLGRPSAVPAMPLSLEGSLRAAEVECALCSNSAGRWRQAVGG